METPIPLTPLSQYCNTPIRLKCGLILKIKKLFVGLLIQSNVVKSDLNPQGDFGLKTLRVNT